jgi:hypothetical protein
MVIYKIFVFGADRKSNMAAKAHMAYSQVELKITVFNYFRNTMKNLKAIYVE